MKIKAYAAQTATSELAPYTIERRTLEKKDVLIDILYCGVCHSDVHIARGEWGGVKYPCVPGHEIIGKVTNVGALVTKYKVGDVVGVGCMVDSCRHCNACLDNLENYCEGPVGATATYNGSHSSDSPNTYGGYSKAIVVDEDFVLKISHPQKDWASVAPLLCAGITTYSPLRHWNIGPGKKVGIVGIGGLGHMSIKFAKALGAYVVAFTTSQSKVDDAKAMGADEVILSTNSSARMAHKSSFDLILNTVAASQNLDIFIQLLKRDATMVLVGIPAIPHSSPMVGNLVAGRRSLAGSLIGGIAETQEMLDFSAKNAILPQIELIAMQDINQAYDRLVKGDVKYRFVIDMATL